MPFGRLNRFVGLARSLWIYHAIPFRQRRLRRLYRHFVRPGDLAFDLGAHVGNHTRALTALGCRVVTVEPQPDFARLLRLLFGRSSLVNVIEAAVTDRPDGASLWISERTPTVTTVAHTWRDARADEPGFSRVRWNRRIDVKTMTLNGLIEQFGVPGFIKIDVEGAEPMVLGGLHHAVAALSFEYLPGALDSSRACVVRLQALGRYEFNWSSGESYRFASQTWLDEQELFAALSTPEAQRRSGEVYARLVSRKE